MKNIFIAYGYVDASGNPGFGNAMLGLSRYPNAFQDIQDMEKAIKQQKNLQNCVILSFQELAEEKQKKE